MTVELYFGLGPRCLRTQMMAAYDSGDLSDDSSSEINDAAPAGIGDCTNKFIKDSFNMFNDSEDDEEEFVGF